MKYLLIRLKIRLIFSLQRIIILATSLPVNNRSLCCPICGYKANKFVDYGLSVRKNAVCPKCRSLKQTRLLYSLLKKILPQNKAMRILHFAPEKPIEKLIISYPKIKSNFDYATALQHDQYLMFAHDHKRLYGRDFVDKLLCQNFKVRVIRALDLLDQKLQKSYAVKGEEIFLCKKRVNFK